MTDGLRVCVVTPADGLGNALCARIAALGCEVMRPDEGLLVRRFAGRLEMDRAEHLKAFDEEGAKFLEANVCVVDARWETDMVVGGLLAAGVATGDLTRLVILLGESARLMFHFADDLCETEDEVLAAVRDELRARAEVAQMVTAPR